MSARTPLFPVRTPSRAGRPSEEFHSFSLAPSSQEANPMAAHKPLNLSGFKRPDAKKDSHQDTADNIYSFQKTPQKQHDHVLSPAPRLASPALASRNSQILQSNSGFKPGGGLFRAPSLPTQQEDNQRALLPQRAPNVRRLGGGQALDKISEDIEEGDSGFSESIEIFGDLPNTTSFNKSANRRDRQEDPDNERFSQHVSKRQRIEGQLERDGFAHYDDGPHTSTPGRSQQQQEELVFDLFGFSIEEYIVEHREEYERKKEHWTNCSTEEWLLDGIALMKEFEEIMDFIRNHIAQKLNIFADIDRIFEEHEKALSGRADELKLARDSLGKDLGGMIGRGRA